jgi:hypothetical protein
MVYGSVMGSFAVSAFSINGFDDVTPQLVGAAARSFRELTHVDLAEPIA